MGGDQWTNNLYTYSGNNPVGFKDPTGYEGDYITGMPSNVYDQIVSNPGSGSGATTSSDDDPYYPPVDAGPGDYGQGPAYPEPDYGDEDGFFNSDGSKNGNAIDIYNYLRSLGWSNNAICALLGNMQAENGTLDPGRGQNGGGAGWGLCQWDPGTKKYLAWASENGYADDSMKGQLDYLVYSMQEGHFDGDNWSKYRQWWATKATEHGFGEYAMLAKDFKISTKSVEFLTKTFGSCYELSDAMIAGGYDWQGRIDFATKWDKYFRENGIYQ